MMLRKITVTRCTERTLQVLIAIVTISTGKWPYQAVSLRITGFLDFSIVRYSRDYKTRRFGNWIYFRPQVKGGEDTY
jgi:hypothetical protein